MSSCDSCSHWDNQQLDVDVIEHLVVCGHHADRVMVFACTALQLELGRKLLIIIQLTVEAGWLFHSKTVTDARLGKAANFAFINRRDRN